MAASDRVHLSTRRGLLVLAATGTLLYAAAAATTRPLTWLAAAAVAVPGAAVVAIAIHRPNTRSQTTGPLRRTLWLWGLVLLAGLLWEAWAFVHQPSWTVGSHDHPTLSVLVGPFLLDPVVRLLAWCLWLAAGWRLLRR